VQLSRADWDSDLKYTQRIQHACNPQNGGKLLGVLPRVGRYPPPAETDFAIIKVSFMGAILSCAVDAPTTAAAASTGWAVRCHDYPHAIEFETYRFGVGRAGGALDVGRGVQDTASAC